MVSITVSKCATTHMEHTTVSVLMVTNFKVMGSHVQVKRFHYDSQARVIIITDYADIDECSNGVDLCEQLCQNTNGSYTCACDPGFRLKSDRLQCEGMVQTKAILLLI
jgi:hypothetical protein